MRHKLLHSLNASLEEAMVAEHMCTLLRWFSFELVVKA